MSVKRIIKDYYQEACILLVIGLIVIRTFPEGIKDLNRWIMTHWVLSYENGFISRGLIGSVVKIFLPVVSLNSLYRIITIIFFFFLMVLMVFLFAILKKEKNNKDLFILIIFFAVNPGTVSMYINAIDFGRFDLFMILIALLSLIFLSVKRFEWIIPVLMVSGVLIHEAFIFMYAPVILTALVLCAFWDGKNRYRVSVLVISTLSMCVSYIVVAIFGKAENMEYSRFISSLQGRADFPISERMVEMEYYYGIKDHFHYVLNQFQDINFIINFIVSLLILSPTFILFACIWRGVFREYKDRRLLTGLMCLSNFAVFILCFIGNDYGRWLSAFIFGNFLSIFILIARGIIKTDGLFNRVAKPAYLWLYTIFVIVYSIIGPMYEVYPFPFINNILDALIK